ncbi:pectinesterase inhibitor-like [Cornus florida]|uniref:pectinesterase inhibitor-like n=1 Tax=Cornus florida TaxID=4283 RepID=UPI00289F0D68|nr:pectinesterase inhibitor-like [Cornus florida]
MAISLSYSSSLLLSILLLSFLLLNHESDAAANELLNSICSTTSKPALCVKALKSDPRTAKADIKGLGGITIDLAQSNAKSTKNMIGSLIKQTSDHKLKGTYQTCHENYVDAISDLDRCKKHLESGDYASLNIHGSAALDGPDTCNDNFEGPLAESSKLKQANEHLEGLCSTILAISSRLKPK